MVALKMRMVQSENSIGVERNRKLSHYQSSQFSWRLLRILPMISAKLGMFCNIFVQERFDLITIV